jgi:hypothetical protein
MLLASSLLELYSVADATTPIFTFCNDRFGEFTAGVY